MRDTSHLVSETPAAKRKRQQRERQRAAGIRLLEIKLTPAEAEWFDQMTASQRGNPEGFAKRALLLGAVFAANAGNPRGSKKSGIVKLS